MKYKRKLLINDRVKGLIQLCLVMAVSVIVVFIGIELLKYLPSLTPEQKKILDTFTYPRAVKVLIVILWGGFASVSAFLYLWVKYSGFINRLDIYFQDIKNGNLQAKFYFRKKDHPAIIQESMEKIINPYIDEIRAQASILQTLKSQLK